MSTNKVNIITLILIFGGWCVCSVLGWRCREDEFLPSYKTFHERLETKVTQCRRMERDTTSNNRVKSLSTSKETDSDDYNKSVTEVDFEKCLLENTPWFPEWMNYPEEFQGFRQVSWKYFS